MHCLGLATVQRVYCLHPTSTCITTADKTLLSAQITGQPLQQCNCIPKPHLAFTHAIPEQQGTMQAAIDYQAVKSGDRHIAGFNLESIGVEDGRDYMLHELDLRSLHGSHVVLFKNTPTASKALLMLTRR